MIEKNKAPLMEERKRLENTGSKFLDGFSAKYKGNENEPTSEDQKWALGLENSTWSFKSRGSKLLDAVKAGYIWRVIFAVSLNESMASRDKFISKSTGSKCLYKAADKGHDNVIEFLLASNFIQKYGYEEEFLRKMILKKSKNSLRYLIENNIIDINEHNQCLLYEASMRENNMSCFLLELGSGYDMALRRIINRGYGGEINHLKSVIEQFEKNKTNAALEEFIPEQENDKKPAIKPWEAICDNIIVKHDRIPTTKTELQTIFNFVSRDVTTICTILNEFPLIMTTNIRNFKEIESDDILLEAWEKLKEQGKNPIPFTGNDNFMVRKPSKPQNVKIEGKSNNGSK